MDDRITVSVSRETVKKIIKEIGGEEALRELDELKEIAVELSKALALNRDLLDFPKPISLTLVARYNELVRKCFPE